MPIDPPSPPTRPLFAFPLPAIGLPQYVVRFVNCNHASGRARRIEASRPPMEGGAGRGGEGGRATMLRQTDTRSGRERGNGGHSRRRVKSYKNGTPTAHPT